MEGKGSRGEERQGSVSSCWEAEAVENKDFMPDDLDPNLSPVPTPVHPTDLTGVQFLCLGLPTVISGLQPSPSAPLATRAILLGCKPDYGPPLLNVHGGSLLKSG